MRLWFLGWSLAGLAAASATPAHDGLKIVVRESHPSGMTETTEYVAADRARTEFRISSVGDRAPQQHLSVHIRRCDLGKNVFLNEADRTYSAAPIDTRLNVIERLALSIARPYSPKPGGRAIVVETTTVDTGERKSAFGHTARRVITTRRQISAGSSDDTSEAVTDGWYIDLDTRISCERAEESRGRSVLIASTGADRRETPPRVTFKDTGAPEQGFAIDTRTTSRMVTAKSREHSDAFVIHRVVTQLTRQPLDVSLFEIPPGFRSADGIFASIAARWTRTATIIESAVGSWFR